MSSLPFLKKYLAAGVTAAVFVAVVVAYAVSGRPSLDTSTAAYQPAGDAPSWPMFGGGPTRNMVNLAAKDLPEEWDNDPKRRRTSCGPPTLAPGPTAARSSPTASLRRHQQPEAPQQEEHRPANGKPIDLGVLMVFDQADGKFLYQTVFHQAPQRPGVRLAAGRLCSTPTVEGNRIYYTSNRCEVDLCRHHRPARSIWKLDMIKELNVFPHNLTASSPAHRRRRSLPGHRQRRRRRAHQRAALRRPRASSSSNKKTGKVLWQDNSPTIKLAAGREGKPRTTTSSRRSSIAAS